MEALQILKLPIQIAKYAGRQMLGGAWSELPALPQGEYQAPVRASIQYYSTPETPDSIELGHE